MNNRLLGLGHDVVDVASFRQQMNEMDSWKRMFAPCEIRQAQLRARLKGDDLALHIAARWAGKEAFLKAWCDALSQASLAYPYTQDMVPWSAIKVVSDTVGRPSIVLDAQVMTVFLDSFGGVSDSHSVWDWRVSLSHDGNFASAVALVQCLCEQ